FSPACAASSSSNNAYFYDITDAELLEELAAQAGLNTEIESTTITHAGMVQFYATDWDFIVTRAEANGKLVLTHDGKLIVKAPEKKDSVLNLRYGGNILDFEALIDADNQSSSVNTYAWNSADQEVVQIEGSAPSVNSPGNISVEDLAEVIGQETCVLKQVGLPDTELQAWADSKLIKAGYAKNRGRVRIQGIGNILPGNFITLEGIGERFNGDALVSGIRHEISTRNWETDISFGLSPDFFADRHRDISAPPANGLLPPISGLQTALVTGLEDPDGEDRIQLRIPMIDPAEEGIWARIATLDAGKQRGSFFRPEINDEVIVGFLNDDPRSPIVLGMLNSKAKPAPLPGSDDNHQKGFISRSEMKLLFDDEKIALTITTPNGNTMSLSDEQGGIKVTDENDNSILMDSSGISIESASDINIKASGDVNIEGANINAKASAAFKAEGGTGAELSSGANTTVKGSIVQIN
ncbi:MAG: type VI secretion system tip protein VgrG, partial [Candidatus Electrothrix sp. ATG1]|nr:type VI secretion system tip protein VgrG [Candidatus Electrothrix sp. ATG1]